MPESAATIALRVLCDIVRGAVGADAYANYRAQLTRHHPERRPLSREEFFRRDTAERWEGIRRCC
jgi:uncharacterized short protein YbdD (DUF466 family)